NRAQEILQSLAERFATTANVKQVFGEPIHSNGRTVVPVARVQYRLGGGWGGGERKDEGAGGPRAGGGGGGGGMVGGCPGGWWRNGECVSGGSSGDNRSQRAIHSFLQSRGRGEAVCHRRAGTAGRGEFGWPEVKVQYACQRRGESRRLVTGEHCHEIRIVQIA